MYHKRFHLLASNRCSIAEASLTRLHLTVDMSSDYNLGRIELKAVQGQTLDLPGKTYRGQLKALQGVKHPPKCGTQNVHDVYGIN
jgi:hypothetical protein